MATPSSAYPLSPVSSAGSPQPDERRRSKRDSTASATRRREEAANRYPSPPPGNAGPATRSRHSIDPALQIPPYNPNRRPAGDPNVRDAPVWTPEAEAREKRQQAIAALGEPQRIPAPHQGNHRPASAAIVPVAAPLQQQQQQGQSASSRSRQSVGYMPTQSTSAGPFPQLYTPHPMPRQKIYFGPYILLQTLGEGEFGKVKLGLHSERWGEEVAIKLIKRGNVDTVQRGEKVRREIEVLKAVRHPNIVRLYDVIETEKYIGIVLEYASGGELFDHILAHRYLKERDASRLFAQLISGVAYLHAKHVVHRDLKLENLLLDRNRNVIITDFGFANRFNTATDDLMATSCGSPCYAAPELVVQEGKYVGTAVDVWSCGVILYAMLAGYLPYDDDPANPEGDNINLLYKYILNTPLSFPDWITAEPRDLLLMMLVPDPTRRCTIEDVTRHSWLRKYGAMFQKTVPELEMQAQEAELQKRQMLEAQRQFLINQQAIAHGGMNASQAQNMTRSQSSTMTAQSRHRSAVVPPSASTARFPMDNQLPPSVPEERAIPGAAPPSGRRSNFVPSTSPTTEVQSITAGASFSRQARPSSVPAVSVAMTPSYSAPPDAPATAEDQIMHDTPVPTRPRRSSTKHSSSSVVTQAAIDAEAEKRKRSHRATVQVEYDSERRSSRSSKTPPLDTKNIVAAPEDVVMSPVEQQPSTPTVEEEPAAEAAATHVEAESTPTPSSPAPIVIQDRPITPPLIPIPFPSTPPRTPAAEFGSNASTPKKRKSSGSPKELEALPPPPALPSVLTLDNDLTPKGKKTSAASAPVTVSAPTEARPPSSASTTASASKHRKNPSSDRFSLRSLLSSSTNGDASRTRTTSAAERARANEARRQAEKLEKEKALDEVTNDRRKSRRQKALSLQPFRSGTAASKIAKAKAEGAINKVSAVADGSRTRSSSSATATQGSMAPPPRPSTANVRPVASRASTAASIESGTPSSKAKAIMGFFRGRSSRGFTTESPPIPTDFDRPSSTRAEPASSAGTSIRTSTPVPSSPAVVVTGADTGLGHASPVSQPSSRSASGAMSHLSHTTTSTVATSISEAPATNAPGTPFDDSKLRFHHGAIAKDALTSRSPDSVMADIRNALWLMGIDAVAEGDYKLKCQRRSKKKAAQGIVAVSAVEQRGIPSSPSIQSTLGSPSSGFRNFFKRSSVSPSNSPALPSPALSLSIMGDPLSSPLSSSVSHFSSLPQPGPTYGDATTSDSGDEVKFHVELTKLQSLPGLFLVEVRRTRGSNWSYAYVYKTFLANLNLGQV